MQHGGMLRAEDVVAAASDARHPLHEHFEWDDSVAAGSFRLWQARELIKVVVTVLPQGHEATMQCYVSLSPDRVEDGGGYRAMVDVLNDSALRAQLVQDALYELERLAAKWNVLDELRPVWRAVHRARCRIG